MVSFATSFCFFKKKTRSGNATEYSLHVKKWSSQKKNPYFRKLPETHFYFWCVRVFFIYGKRFVFWVVCRQKTEKNKTIVIFRKTYWGGGGGEIDVLNSGKKKKLSAQKKMGCRCSSDLFFWRTSFLFDQGSRFQYFCFGGTFSQERGSREPFKVGSRCAKVCCKTSNLFFFKTRIFFFELDSSKGRLYNLRWLDLCYCKVRIHTICSY